MCSFYCVLLQSQVAFYFYGYCYHLFYFVSVAKTASDTKAASYDIIATNLREKIHVPKEQFEGNFLALVADKEYTRIFDTIAKVEKSFGRPTPYFRAQARGNLRSSSHPRVTCYRCGTPGHKSTQCWKRVPAARNFSPGHPGHNQPRPASH